MTIVFFMIQRRGRLRTLIPGYTCSHYLCIAQWASNWIYLSPVLSNIKEKTVTSLYFRYESYSRPTIHPTVTICILKIYQNHPHGEDLSYRQFCRWFKSAARSYDTREFWKIPRVFWSSFRHCSKVAVYGHFQSFNKACCNLSWSTFLGTF